jgi:hypothetical protein
MNPWSHKYSPLAGDVEPWSRERGDAPAHCALPAAVRVGVVGVGVGGVVIVVVVSDITRRSYDM